MRHKAVIAAAVVIVLTGLYADQVRRLPSVDPKFKANMCAEAFPEHSLAQAAMFEYYDGYRNHHGSAVMNMDGSWTFMGMSAVVSVTKWDAIESARGFSLEHDTLTHLRLLMAYPFLRKVSPDQAAYIGTHRETWGCKSSEPDPVPAAKAVPFCDAGSAIPVGDGVWMEGQGDCQVPHNSDEPKP